jgi:hypothetical protein
VSDPAPNIPSVLERLQTVVVNRLTNDPLFQGGYSLNQLAIPIITELKADITQSIALALDSVGTCVLVLTPVFEFINNLLFDLNGWALISITIFENVTVNQSSTGTKIRSVMTAQRVLALLHRYPHGLPVPNLVLSDDIPCFIGVSRPIELTNEGPPLQYTVNFQAYVALP